MNNIQQKSTRVIPRFKSIKYKFLITNLVMIVLFCGSIIYFWNYRTEIDARVSAANYINEMLKVSNDNLEVSLKDIYGMVNVASSDSEIVRVLSKSDYDNDIEYLQDDRTVTKYIVSLFTYKHYLNDITIANNKDRTYSLGHSVTHDFLMRQPWYLDLVNKDGKTILIPPHYNSENPIISPSLDDRVISIAKPVIVEDSVKGFVLADVRSQLLTDIFSHNLKNQVKVFVADTKKGSIIFNPDLGDNSSSDSAQQIQNIIKRTSGKEGSFFTHLGTKDNLIVYRYSPLTEWTMIGIVPKAVLMEQFHQTRNGTMLLSILFCLIAAIVTIFVSSLLTKSILRLNKAINKVDAEHLDFNIQIRSGDEIGQLYEQFNHMVQRMKELIDNTKRTEREKRNAEIRALQAQINPHFLYNTLNTIKFLSVYQGADNISDVAESLSKLMHINMQEKFFITVGEELEYLQSYVNIQKYKYNNKFTYSVSVEEDMKSYLIPKLLLQPFLENALIHGIGPMKGHGVLLLKGYKENNVLRFRLQDNGVGMQGSIADRLLGEEQGISGLGVRNVQSRIRTTFGSEYGVSIISELHLYTIVEVTLPAITAQEESNYV